MLVFKSFDEQRCKVFYIKNHFLGLLGDSGLIVIQSKWEEHRRQTLGPKKHRDKLFSLGRKLILRRDEKSKKPCGKKIDLIR